MKALTSLDLGILVLVPVLLLLCSTGKYSIVEVAPVLALVVEGFEQHHGVVDRNNGQRESAVRSERPPTKGRVPP